MLRRVVDAVLRGRGSLPQSAGALCFEEDNSLNGGLYIWRMILEETVRCLSSRALNVDQTVVISLDTDPETFREIMDCESYRLEVLDGYDDPEGWLADAGYCFTSAPTHQLKLSAEGLDEGICSTLTAKSAVVLDSVTSLVFRLSLPYVVRLLLTIRGHPNCCCILARYHTEGQDKMEVDAIRSVFSGRLQLTALNEVLVPLCESVPDGALTSFQTSETGRILSQTEWYQVNRTGGEVVFFPAPDASAMDSAKLVEADVNQRIPDAHIGKDHSSLEETLMKRMEGGMKLTLTKQEKAAKEDVILPYERAADVSGLGEIHYVRDSEEDYDSDEDPDDDLDI